jgi:hypothetical protein
MRRYDYLFRRGRKKGFNLVFIGGHGLAAFAHRDLTPPAGGHESALALTAQQSPLGVFHLRGDAEQTTTSPACSCSAPPGASSPASSRRTARTSAPVRSRSSSPRRKPTARALSGRHAAWRTSRAWPCVSSMREQSLNGSPPRAACGAVRHRLHNGA